MTVNTSFSTRLDIFVDFIFFPGSGTHHNVLNLVICFEILFPLKCGVSFLFLILKPNYFPISNGFNK